MLVEDTKHNDPVPLDDKVHAEGEATEKRSLDSFGNRRELIR